MYEKQWYTNSLNNELFPKKGKQARHWVNFFSFSSIV